MTVWQAYCSVNHGIVKERTGLESFVGQKVRHIIYSKDREPEVWSETIHTIESFDDDTCGQGCCNGFTISDSDISWRSDQLELV